MEGLWTRFLPVISKAAEWTDRIGGVRAVHLTLCANRDPKQYVRLFDPGMYGGALRDLGVYCLHIARHFCTGKKIKALHPLVVPSETGVDLSTFVILEYEDGITATIQCSIGMPSRNEGYIYGRNGYMRMGPWLNAPRRVELYTAPFIMSDAPVDQIPAEIFTSESTPGFEEEIRHAAECVRQGKKESPVVSLADTIEAVEITEKILNLM
jgi:predicted dehydrogenase